MLKFFFKKLFGRCAKHANFNTVSKTVHQDAEEFFRLFNLTSILSSFEIPSVVKWQMFYRCKNCDAISSDAMEEHPDLILSLGSQQVEGSLKNNLDNFCDGKETKKCCNCSVTGFH